MDILKSNREREFRQWFHINEDFTECQFVDAENIRASGNGLHLNAQFLTSNDNTQEILIFNGSKKPYVGWRCTTYGTICPIYSISHLVKSEECVMMTSFSLTGGEVDVAMEFENNVLGIKGRINGKDIQLDEQIG